MIITRKQSAILSFKILNNRTLDSSEEATHQAQDMLQAMNLGAATIEHFQKDVQRLSVPELHGKL